LISKKPHKSAKLTVGEPANFSGFVGEEAKPP